MSDFEYDRQAADDAFMAALEERRQALKDAGEGFDERSHAEFKKAYDENRLVGSLVAGVARGGGQGPANHQTVAMAKSMNASVPTWEELLLLQGEPWTPYVTEACRRGARAAIAQAEQIREWVKLGHE
jgi:hypothetical protein